MKRPARKAKRKSGLEKRADAFRKLWHIEQGDSVKLYRTIAEQSLMLDCMAKALEAASGLYGCVDRECEELVYEQYALKKEIEKLQAERREFCDFMHDVEVILAHHSADAICGSKWIPAQALLNARKRYAERTSA
jgi:hypothetical protein